jgi:hypothetical protein
MIFVHLVWVSFGRCREGHTQDMLKRLFHGSNLPVPLLSVGPT